MADSTPRSQQLIRELFDIAREIPAGEQRNWVEANAAGNPEIVASVMRLLQAANASGQGFLAEPAWKREQPALREGMMIGPYRVLRELGAGGMGVVYLAMRSDEVYRRLVAVKVIRPELKSNPLKGRFLQEREILARLDHPNIARIVDGGNTPDGLPYFVMDYVDGQPLDEYCRLKRATMEQRLNLFRQTCEAVQYLHANHVLHRDLKPANILVTHTGQIKLLDFGVSKLSGEFASTQTTGMPILTAGYASPEQISSKKVTEAADIYSLGVVLYELLTGVRPLKFDGLNLTQIMTAITFQMPPRPSTQQPLPEDADPGRLLASMRPQLAGDLDSILLMALRKEPERRYASAADFAADIERFQKGKSVVARGDAKTYLVMRTVKRNRWKIAVGAVVLLSLSLGSAAFYLYLQAQDKTKLIADAARQLEQHQAMYATLPPEKAHALIQTDLNRLSTELEKVSPDLMKSNFAAKGITRELTQKSLANFVETGTATGNDPATVASLGRAYLAVAETQWSPDHASLNEPKAAAATCMQALQTLNATPQLGKSPLVQAIARQIAEQLNQNPEAHTTDNQD
jgi:serine/threonine protein kinase